MMSITTNGVCNITERETRQSDEITSLFTDDQKPNYWGKQLATLELAVICLGRGMSLHSDALKIQVIRCSNNSFLFNQKGNKK